MWKSVYDALPLGTNAQLDQSGHDFGGTNAQESCPVFKALSDQCGPIDLRTPKASSSNSQSSESLVLKRTWQRTISQRDLLALWPHCSGRQVAAEARSAAPGRLASSQTRHLLPLPRPFPVPRPRLNPQQPQLRRPLPRRVLPPVLPQRRLLFPQWITFFWSWKRTMALAR